MEISIRLRSHAQDQVAHLVALLRSMDFVEHVSIKTDDVKTTEKVENRFDKHNGAWKNKLPIEEIDLQLNELRKEWERVL
jgi:hypothetical protein